MSIVVTYCERVHPGIFAEPFNSLSNIGYLIVAWQLYRRWRCATGRDPAIVLLALLLAFLGVGSAAFHGAPSTLTLLMDVMPILMLMLAYCWLIQTRLLAHSTALISGSILALLGSTLYLAGYSGVANGSLMYLPTLLFSTVACWLLRNHRSVRPICYATGALLAALVFRTLDNTFCDIVPLGTHVLWHLLTAVACSLAAKAIFSAGDIRDMSKNTS